MMKSNDFTTSTWDVSGEGLRGLAEREAHSGEAHARTIAQSTAAALFDKYMRGQREHGGDLRRKAGMLAHVEDENRDQTVYVHTLREQLAELRTQAAALLAGLDKVLGAPEQ